MMDKSDLERIARARNIESVGLVLNEMHSLRNDLRDTVSTSNKMRAMPMPLRRRQAYRIGQIIEELDKLSLNLRYHGGSEVPKDLEAYFKKLRDSIPTE